MVERWAAITSDIDTLASIYKGHGCRRPGGYTYAELRMGLEAFDRFLEPYGLRATLFMVGGDFRHSGNHAALRAAAARHELANHTLSHIQGFRWLTPAAKEAEIAGMEALCVEVTGQQPVGFRAPGWNIADDAQPILRRRGYRYDSSVHPTVLTPVLKGLHWWSMRGKRGGDRTTLGPSRHMLAPAAPYRTGPDRLDRPGAGPFVEFPVTVTPGLRLPFFATFLLATGWDVFRASYRALRDRGRPIQFQFHLSDFVDYRHPDLVDQVPDPRDGVYVPQALTMPLPAKLDLWRRALDMIVADYTFLTLAEWAAQVAETHVNR